MQIGDQRFCYGTEIRVEQQKITKNAVGNQFEPLFGTLLELVQPPIGGCSRTAVKFRLELPIGLCHSTIGRILQIDKDLSSEQLCNGNECKAECEYGNVVFLAEVMRGTAIC